MPRIAAMQSPQPLLIAAAAHTCVAWWHAPAPDPDAAPVLPLAVVLASSWGEEDIAGCDGQRAPPVAPLQHRPTAVRASTSIVR